MRPLGRSRTLPVGSTRPPSCDAQPVRIALDGEVERRLDHVGGGYSLRAGLAVSADPSRPQPVRRVHPRRIEARDDRLAVLGDTPEHGIDELVVASGARIVLGKPHGKVDRRVRWRLQEDELRRCRQQYRIKRAGLVRQPTVEKFAEHVIDLRRGAVSSLPRWRG